MHKNNIILLVCVFLMISEIIQAQSTVQYTYDALNRITQIQYPDGIMVQYTYQPNGNRITKTVSPTSGLPIELTKFNAHKGDETMTTKLSWQTSSEINGSHFDVEWSTDGAITFSKIGEVNAIGNSTTLQNYQYIHTTPQVGVNYYRLKSVDIGGTFEYSGVRAVEFEDIWGDITILPNPTSDNAKLVLDRLEYGAFLQLYDVSGKIIWTKQIPPKTTVSTIELSELPSGMYFLRLQSINNENFVKTFKIEKL